MRKVCKEDSQKILQLYSLIKEGKIDSALSVIRKEKLQGLIPNVLNQYISVPNPEKEIIAPFDDSYYKKFISEFLKYPPLFSYDTKHTKGISVLTELSKTLGDFDDSFWRKESQKFMQLFVLNFISREKKRNTNKPKDLKLFCFRRISDYLLSEISDNSLRLSTPESFNDPFDCLILVPIRERLDEVKRKPTYGVHTYVEELQKIRVCCFAGWSKPKDPAPYLNTLMWAHYAESHKGICIEYSIEENSPLLNNGFISEDARGRLDKVQYKDPPTETKEHLNYTDCFLVKDKAWKYEREYRLVYYDTKREDLFYTVPLSALGMRISSIYFGINCNNGSKRLIKKIMDGEKVKFIELERDKGTMNIIKVKE